MMKEIKKVVSEVLEKEQEQDLKIEESGLVLAGETLPTSLPILPIRPRPFFPGLHIPLEVGEENLPVVKLALKSATGTLGIVLVKDQQKEDSPENLHPIGVAAKIIQAITDQPGVAHILISCLERFAIKDLQETSKGLFARVEYHYATELSSNQELKAYSMAIISALKDLMALNPLHAEVIRLFLTRSSLDDPGQLADFAASLTTADGQELQKVLEAFNVRKRLDHTLVLLKKEIEILKLQKRITDQIEEKMTAQQREFFLKEQLKAIKQELGLEKEGKASEIEKFQQRLEGLTLNPEAQQAVDEELEKLQILDSLSPEYTVSRNYLDWLTILPWGKLSQDNYDLDQARKVLDRDHYGLDDVKTRILEFIAVGKIKGDIAGSILCLVGPPGVGKTSVGRSVAHALGRQFYRFSLGGMRDEAEIKGHRRTYIGAMPGKIIQALKTVGTANPVIMLDEIDKVGASFQGDPASALLEVLDIEQNPAFRDHYLDVPFDLSDILFITTANQLDTVPLPLIDRMEVIRLSGYILEEKVEIARRYLIPKTLRNFGLKKSHVTIRKTALKKIIEGYAREAGVRGLEKLVRKIFRKCAVELADDPKRNLVITSTDVETYLGQAFYTDEELLENRPGVVTGLAWTSLGGTTLQIEATAVISSRKGFKQTGQLGDVMVESSEIAYSYVMAHLDEYGSKPDFFDQHFVHLHVPAGATPKDGPSAGITMATALISMILQKKVKKGLAMSGELTLTGRILPIGGVKEKVIAARRIGLKVLIFPQGNQKDIDELPDHLGKGLTFLSAADFSDVYRQAFRHQGTKR